MQRPQTPVPDHRDACRRQGAYEVEPPASIERLGDYSELKELFSEHAIDIVIVADLNPTRGELLELVTPAKGNASTCR